MIDKFITEVKQRGLARTNTYEVKVSLPGTSSKGDELISVFCDAVNLPGLSIATQPSRTYGEIREMPYEPMYEPVQLSFYVDSNMEVKKAFERWMASIVNVNSREMFYYNSYIRDVSIKVVTRDYQPIPQSEQLITTQSHEVASPYFVILSEAYPKAISAIQLDTGSKDLMKLNVTLQYKYWRSGGASEMASVLPSLNSSSPIQNSSGIVTGQGYPIELSKSVQYDANTVYDYGGA